MVDESGNDEGQPRRAELTRADVESFRVARVIRNHSKPISSMCFHQSGDVLVSGGSDDKLVFIDPRSGAVRRVTLVKKYGCGTVRFTSGFEESLLLTTTTTTGADHDIRALDVETSQYSRYFAGHTAKVVDIVTSPTESTSFLSSSMDMSVRLWDTRQKDASARLQLQERPIVAYDNKGLVFGIAYLDKTHGQGDGQTVVKLYDPRNFEEGAFSSFKLDVGPSGPTCFSFSPDGENFLLASAHVGNPVRIFDAYEGKHRKDIHQPRSRNTSILSASFSADAKFLMTGAEDHGVALFELSSSTCILDAPKKHVLPVAATAWSPSSCMIATACQNVALWLPNTVGHEAMA